MVTLQEAIKLAMNKYASKEECLLSCTESENYYIFTFRLKTCPIEDALAGTAFLVNKKTGEIKPTYIQLIPEMPYKTYDVRKLQYEDCLIHYGVKGMKWGVRKKEESSNKRNNKRKAKEEPNEENQEYLIDPRKWSTRKKIAVGMGITMTALAAYGAVRYKHNVNNPDKWYVNKNHRIVSMNFGEKMDLSTLSKEDRILPKGNFYRMSTKSIEDYTNSGRVYVSHKLSDRVRYKERMPRYFREWGAKGIVETDGSVYEHTLKTNRPIKIASDRAIAEAYMKVNKVNEVDHGYYTQFMQNLTNKDNKIAKKFFDELSKQGYDAVVDKNDAGYLGKDPLILMNPSSYISSKSRKIGTIEKVINTILL